MKKSFLAVVFMAFCAAFFSSSAQGAIYSRHGVCMRPQGHYISSGSCNYYNYGYYPPMMSYVQSKRYYKHMRPYRKSVVNVNFPNHMPKNGHSNINVFISL